MAEQPQPQRPEFDISRFFSDLKFPQMPDLQMLTEANRRNVEAFTAANRVAMEGAQAIARRHMEIMQQALGDMTEAVRALSTAETPQARAAQQSDLLKTAYERAVKNLQELSEMIQRSNNEAMALLHRRFTEAMDELKALGQKAG